MGTQRNGWTLRFTAGDWHSNCCLFNHLMELGLSDKQTSTHKETSTSSQIFWILFSKTRNSERKYLQESHRTYD